MAPDGRVYRATTMHMLDGGGLERIQAAPFPIWVLTAAFPRFVPGPVAATIGLLGYAAEKRLFPTRIHPRLGRALGFRPVAIDARSCGPGAACTWPRPARWRRIDGTTRGRTSSPTRSGRGRARPACTGRRWRSSSPHRILRNDAT